MMQALALPQVDVTAPAPVPRPPELPADFWHGSTVVPSVRFACMLTDEAGKTEQLSGSLVPQFSGQHLIASYGYRLSIDRSTYKPVKAGDDGANAVFDRDVRALSATVRRAAREYVLTLPDTDMRADGSGAIVGRVEEIVGPKLRLKAAGPCRLNQMGKPS